MDNAPGAGLPPLMPALQTPAPLMPGMGAPQPPRSMGLQGRPLSDPEQQAAKAEKTAEAKRLEGMSPGRAKDYKLKVFKTDSTGRARGKEILTLLSSQVQDELKDIPQGTEAYDDALDGFVIGRLPEEAPDGVSKCQWHDKTNKPVASPPPWELQVGEATGATADLDEAFEDDEPSRAFPVHQSFAPPAPSAPPAPPALDLAAVGNAFRAERREEATQRLSARCRSRLLSR